MVEGGGVIAASVQLQPLRPKVQVSHCRHIHVSDHNEWSDVASIPFFWLAGNLVLGSYVNNFVINYAYEFCV